MNEDNLLTRIMLRGTEIFDNIDELKGEYVWDWEDEFDNIHEAYEEQGRGEAESQAISEIVKDEVKKAGLALTDDVLADLMDKVAGSLGVSLS
jgi:hypothetical protein